MSPSVALPTHSAVFEKYGHKPQRSWTRSVFFPIPGIPNRRLRVVVPNIDSRYSNLRLPKLSGRRRTPLLICLACMAVVTTVMLFSRSGGGTEWVDSWQPVGDPPTLVFERDDLQRIWDWEIRSGHYPSRHSIPKEIGFTTSPKNPALPAKQRRATPSRYRPPPSVVTTDADTDPLGVGPKRIYLDIQSVPPHVAYPPRPVPGSVADMDIIMKHCDYSQGKYVRDCLEVLRLGGGLDNGQRARRGKMDDWKYIYLEESNSTESQIAEDDPPFTPNPVHRHVEEAGESTDRNTGLVPKRGADWEPHLKLPPTLHHRPNSELPDPCDPDNPRIFHMFWAGAFTDKPYLALLSFLFTQNTGIHLHSWPADSPLCRPQFWLWINPGPAAAVPNPNALSDMFESLKASPWAAPFLHPRFKDVIKFKMWNTTEQLDGVPEIKDEWRALQDSLFNSGGHIIEVKHQEAEAETTSEAEAEEGESVSAAVATSKKKDGDDMLNRLGSKSSSTYDRMSVILSDMARFVLCHRFGGIYLDADTIFLRDWEELWGWKGAFAYRWSRLEKYNTAVLRMNKNSALGSFLFRTALKNGLDFHPMTVSRYLADAYLEGLLLRLPDALFDSAWLNTEYYQRDRPPQPYFSEFSEFFDTPLANSAAPQTLGFHGFFKGAYSYHFHNFWWKPFDPTRNWPDLGQRFIAGERSARKALRTEHGEASGVSEEDQDPLDDPVELDKRDLDWSTVLKRTFESYVRGERPNMYGEWVHW